MSGRNKRTCRHLIYTRQDGSRFALACGPLNFDRLPAELITEPTRFRDRIRADVVCKGPKGGPYKLFTGFKKTGFEHWRYGDQFNRGQKHLILFHLFPDQSELHLFYFEGYYPGNRHRQRFISANIPRLIQAIKKRRAAV